MRHAGLEETQAGIKIAGRNTNDLRYADDTTLMTESEEELKCLLMKVKEESEKVGLNVLTHFIFFVCLKQKAKKQTNKQKKAHLTVSLGKPQVFGFPDLALTLHLLFSKYHPIIK